MLPASRLRLILSFAISFSLITFLTIDLFGQPIRSRASGSSIVVNSNGDSATCSGGTITLRCAIATANANTTTPTLINFNFNGTITVASILSLTNTNQPITIDGSGQSITIDGGNTTQIFTVNSGITAILNVLTISNGTNIYGTGNAGGVCNYGTLTINSSMLSANFASYAGAVNNHGTMTINNSTLFANFASYGGGVSNEGTLAINNSTLSANSAIDGSSEGGGVNNSGTMTISNSVLSGNSAQYGGGAINGGTLTIINSTLTNNSAPDGGGVDNIRGTLTISNSTFYHNSAPNGYDGAVTDYNGTLTISNSTLYANSAYYGGGGVDKYGSTLTISNSTLSNNSVKNGDGGGVFIDQSTLNLLSTLVAGNSGTDPDIYGPVNSLGYNLIGDNTGSTGLANGTNGDQVGSSVSGINPWLGNLEYSGGATETVELLLNSPAIGHGNCEGNNTVTPAILAVPTDQRGFLRKVQCDVGAYETNSPIITDTLTPTSTSTNTPTSTNTSTVTPRSTSTNTPTVTLSSTATSTATPTNTPTSTATSTATPLPGRIDTIGIYRGGTFYLRLHNTQGFADITAAFTAGTKPNPVVGDWTGAGFDSIGVFDQSNGQFTLCTVNVTASCANVANQKTLVLGIPNDQPLSGRWSVSATNAGVGVFRPSNGLIYLKTGLTTGYADFTMVLGIPGDVGLAGDWNSKGFDSPGVYRPSNSRFYLSNKVINGSVFGDYQFAYGLGGDAPVTGDWISQGHDGVGLFRQSNGYTYLKNLLITGYADNTFTYGIAGDVPIAGHWQSVYPPIAPAPVLIAKTTVPSQSNGSMSGDNPIGD